MSIGGVGNGSSMLSNLFCDASSGPSKWAQARKAGMAAKQNQENSFAGKMQALVEAAAAQMNSVEPKKKYTEVLKIKNQIQQGMNTISNEEVAKASEANLEEMKERIKQKAEEAQQERSQEAGANGEAQTGVEGGNAAAAADLPAVGGQDASSSGDMPDLPGGSGAPAAEAATEAPELQAASTPAASASPSSSGGGSSGGRVRIDVIV